MDLAVEIPGYMEDLDILRNIQSEGGDVVEPRRKLIAHCQSTIDQFVVWVEEAKPILDTFDYAVKGLPLPVPKDDGELGILHLSCSYWMACIFLSSTYRYACEVGVKGHADKEEIVEEQVGGNDDYGSKEGLQTVISDSGTEKSKTVQEGASAEEEDADDASNHTTSHKGTRKRPPGPTTEMDPVLNSYRIARCIHLFFEPNFGAYAINTAIFPLAVALRYLLMVEPVDQLSEERKLLVQMFEKPFLGTVVGRFLRNLQKESADKTPGQDIPGAEGRHVRAKYWWSREGPLDR